jgi:hypothetical protein
VRNMLLVTFAFSLLTNQAHAAVVKNSAPRPVQAATSAAEPSPEDTGSDIADEAPPRPEPPYPGAEEGAFAADPSMVVPNNNTRPEPEVARDVDSPVRTDEDGNYYYDTKPVAPKARLRHGIDKPKGTTVDGEFLYETKSAKPKFSGRPGVEAPVETTTSGEYRYKVETSKPHTSASFRFGGISPPSVKNRDNGVTFAQLYGDTPQPILLGDYEFRLTSKVGRLGLKLGSGLMVTNAGGRFKSPARQTETPEERFTFALFPNTLTASYRFQYAERQIFVPFVEGGGGYFTFVEIRDDAKAPKFGGSAVAVAAGGFNILLDWLDPHAIRQLDLEYGINHVWFTLELRSIVGLKKDIDFTSMTGDAGFMMEF